MNGTLNRYTHFVGRLLVSAIFVVTGFAKLTHWSGTAAFMASKGMPAIPVLLAIAILFELGGGLAILVGYRTRLAALALSLHLVVATLVFHNFWAYPPAEQQEQMIHFLKNLAILGGMLRLLSDGAGALSLDAGRLRASASAR